MANPNFQLLVDAAKLLKPILGELVLSEGAQPPEQAARARTLGTDSRRVGTR